MSSIPLEELIKTNLENYEARYDSNDWTRMETVLGTTPDSRPFNWKPVLIVFIVLGLLGGGYVLFTTVDFSKILSKSTPVSTPPAVVKKAPVIPPKKTITPTPPPTPAPVVNTDSIRQAEEAAAAAALAAKEEEERKQREEAEKEEARLKKERRKEKEEPTKEEIELRRARRRAMANADSGKTNTSSNESTKEAEKPKSTHIGLNIFSTMNADSLKKYQEKAKKDSTK